MTSYNALVVAVVLLFVGEGRCLNSCKGMVCPNGEECVSIVPNCGRPPCARIGYCVKTDDICPPCPIDQIREYDARGCKTCKCYDPCQGVTCRKNQECVVRGRNDCVSAVCVDGRDLMCYAWGDPHYVLFDGANIDYQAVRWYIMTQRRNQGMCQLLPDFQVLVEHEYRNGITTVSYVKQIMLILPGVVIINIGHNNVTTVVSGSIPPGMAIANVMIPAQPALYIWSTITMIRITTSFGLVLTFDGNSWVSVNLPPAYSNCVQGLCGNADGNKDNDYRTLQGVDVSKLPLNKKFWAIGNSMLVNVNGKALRQSKIPTRLEAVPLTGKEQQADTEDLSCNDEIMEIVESDDYCGFLKNKDGPFGECIKKMPDLAATVFNGCKYDVCANKDVGQKIQEMAVDTSIRTFVSACARNGFLTKIVQGAPLLISDVNQNDGAITDTIRHEFETRKK